MGMPGAVGSGAAGVLSPEGVAGPPGSVLEHTHQGPPPRSPGRSLPPSRPPPWPSPAPPQPSGPPRWCGGSRGLPLPRWSSVRPGDGEGTQGRSRPGGEGRLLLPLAPNTGSRGFPGGLGLHSHPGAPPPASGIIQALNSQAVFFCPHGDFISAQVSWLGNPLTPHLLHTHDFFGLQCH